VLGSFLRDVARLIRTSAISASSGPMKTVSNLLQAIFEVTNRQWDLPVEEDDDFLAPARPGSRLDAQRNTSARAGWRDTC